MLAPSKSGSAYARRSDSWVLSCETCKACEKDAPISQLLQAKDAGCLKCGLFVDAITWATNGVVSESQSVWFEPGSLSKDASVLSVWGSSGAGIEIFAVEGWYTFCPHSIASFFMLNRVQQSVSVA